MGAPAAALRGGGGGGGAGALLEDLVELHIRRPFSQNSVARQWKNEKCVLRPPGDWEAPGSAQNNVIKVYSWSEVIWCKNIFEKKEVFYTGCSRIFRRELTSKVPKSLKKSYRPLKAYTQSFCFRALCSLLLWNNKKQSNIAFWGLPEPGKHLGVLKTT